MDGREFDRQIQRAWVFFNRDLGLGRAFIAPRSAPADEEFKRVALEPESIYSEIYLSGLSRSAYNFILRDYAYFQFGWETENAWRMAYFPNPWITGIANTERIIELWENEERNGSLTHEDVSNLISELPYNGAVPPIRFEYARGQYREIAHPAAHFHVGRNSDNRWPCSVLLGPRAFSMMIARLYYRAGWVSRSSFFPEGEGTANCLDLQFAEAIGAAQAVHEFSAMERRSLHFGRNMIAAEHHGPERGPAVTRSKGRRRRGG